MFNDYYSHVHHVNILGQININGVKTLVHFTKFEICKQNINLK